MNEAAHIEWHAQEHYHTERGSDWYWALGIIAVSVALTAIIFSNFLFALLVLVAAGTMALIAHREPPVVAIACTDEGLVVGETLYPFDAINAFWIDHMQNGDRVLFVDTTRIMNPDLIIPLPDDIDVHAVQEYFLSYNVHEKKMHEPLSYRLMEFIGF